jgi:hypothetical protein
MGIFDKLFGKQPTGMSAEDLGRSLGLLALAQVDESIPFGVFRTVKAFGTGTPTLKASVQREWLIFSLFIITTSAQKRLDTAAAPRTLDTMHRTAWNGLEASGMSATLVTQLEVDARKRYAEYYELLKGPNPGMALPVTIINHIYKNPIPNEPPPGAEFDTTLEVVAHITAFSGAVNDTLRQLLGR